MHCRPPSRPRHPACPRHKQACRPTRAPLPGAAVWTSASAASARAAAAPSVSLTCGARTTHHQDVCWQAHWQTSVCCLQACGPQFGSAAPLPTAHKAQPSWQLASRNAPAWGWLLNRSAACWAALGEANLQRHSDVCAAEQNEPVALMSSFEAQRHTRCWCTRRVPPRTVLASC